MKGGDKKLLSALLYNSHSSIFVLFLLLPKRHQIIAMPSNNNIMSIKFGPNKTAKQFYVQSFLSCALLILLAIICTVILISYSPQLQKSIHQYFHAESAASSSSPTRSRSEIQNETHSPSPSKLSERNDLDPFFNPVDALPDDLFPGSSDAGKSEVTSDGTASPTVTKGEEESHEEEPENPNDVQGSVMKVTWVKPKPVDMFAGNDIVTKTRLGKVKGIQGDVLGHKVNAYLGIPYTEEAPIGGRRFTRSTKLATPWQGVLNAQSFKPHCPQVFDEDVIDKRTVVVHDIAEDCLYLNLWSPVRRSPGGQSLSPKELEKDSRKKLSSSPLKPVMVWIFGGGYSGGSNNLDEMDGRMLAALGDVIVVTLNYRVGSFGFLDMGVNDSPGNMGLYDCLAGLLNLRMLCGRKINFTFFTIFAAIQFVKDHVESFGGDPNEMTLFGQSAGAISIGLLMTNNHTSKYFKRVIMESGSPIMLNFFFTRSEAAAEKFVKALNCSEPVKRAAESDEITDLESNTSTASDQTTTEVSTSPDPAAEDRDYDERKIREVQCLKKKTMEELLVAQRLMVQVAFPFTPTPLEQLLPIMPYDALTAEPGSKAYQDTFNNFEDVLIGSNSDEASVILHLEIPQIFETHEIKLNITTLEGLKDFLINNLSSEFSIDYQTAILFTNVFFNRGPENDTTLNLVKRLYQVVGDLAFVCPVVAFADAMASRGKNVYQYEFGYRSSVSPWGKWMGVTHGDEYIFTFGHPLRYPDRYSQDDITMSRRMIEIWTTFARTG